MMIVTIQHLHACPAWNGRVGFCARGARTWCVANNIDWQDFVANGIEAERLLATGDAMAGHLVNFAMSVEANNG